MPRLRCRDTILSRSFPALAYLVHGEILNRVLRQAALASDPDSHHDPFFQHSPAISDGSNTPIGYAELPQSAGACACTVPIRGGLQRSAAAHQRSRS